MEAQNKIIVGLDVDMAIRASYFVRELPDCSIFKIGPHFRHDPEMSRGLLDRDFRNDFVDDVRQNPFWFEDSKLFDIDATVEAGVRNIANHCNEYTGEKQFRFITVHAHVPVMRAAVRAARDSLLKILAVPLMTSFGEDDLKEFYNYEHDSIDFVCDRVARALAAGCHGVVCSAQEVVDLRRAVPDDFVLVVPGTRPERGASQDHKRSGTPAQAIRDGADYLVFGRPIIDADEPRRAFDEIVKEIETA